MNYLSLHSADIAHARSQTDGIRHTFCGGQIQSKKLDIS